MLKNSREKMIAEDIINYCRETLNIPKDISIAIAFEDLSEDNVKGWVYDEAGTGEYDIEIDNSLGFRELVTTICHEMVHVQQLVEGRDLDDVEAYEKEDLLAKEFF